MATRRTPAEVAALVEKVKELVAGGKTIEAASKEAGISRSVYDRHVSGKVVKVKKPGKHGRVDVSTLPPRPQKKRRGGIHVVDLESIKSVAGRIAYLDKLLSRQQSWVEERVELVGVLVKLLGHAKKK